MQQSERSKRNAMREEERKRERERESERVDGTEERTTWSGY